MKLTESSWLHCISYFLFPFSSWVTTHLQISMLNRWPQGHFNLPPSTKRRRRNCSLESLKGTRNQSCVPPCSCNNDSQMLENSVTEQRASFSKSNFRTQTHTHTGTLGFPGAVNQDSKCQTCPGGAHSLPPWNRHLWSSALCHCKVCDS